MRRGTFYFYASLIAISLTLLSCSEKRGVDGAGGDAEIASLGDLDATDIPAIETDTIDAGSEFPANVALNMSIN